VFSWIRARVTYANTTSTLALFVALGGTSYAIATGAIGSREIKNNSVRSKDVRNGTILGKDVRREALGGRQVNERSLSAVPSATDANALGGAPAGDYLKTGTPAGGALTGSLPNPGLARQVAQLTLNSGWVTSAAAPGLTPAAIKDGYGIVHLEGEIERFSGTEAVAFTLPPGFRPPVDQYLHALVSGGSGQLFVGSDGTVRPEAVGSGTDPTAYTSLNGVSFFAGP
jgi:hypothetical protein